MINFNELIKSNFYKVGRSRYDYVNDEFITYELSPCMFETTDLTAVDLPTIHPNKSRHMHLFFKSTIMHLRSALETNHPNWLCQEFRELIGRQWIEVDEIIKSLPSRSISSYLTIQTAGVEVVRHRHFVFGPAEAEPNRQTISFCYSYPHDKKNLYSKSYLQLKTQKSDIEYRVEYPEEQKTYFEFIGDPWHASYSNEWRFFYFYDFDERIDLPKDIDFKYLDCSVDDRNK